ncbi:MAG: hypothetical protein QMC78_00615 [Methanocellales archaeon]|nr:hypothetical protein [Methanocellales archaeon]
MAKKATKRKKVAKPKAVKAEEKLETRKPEGIVGKIKKLFCKR